MRQNSYRSLTEGRNYVPESEQSSIFIIVLQNPIVFLSDCSKVLFNSVCCFLMFFARFRVMCHKLCTHSYWCNFILFCILASSITLAAEDPLKSKSPRNIVMLSKISLLKSLGD